MNFAIILSGGVGSRMKLNIPKQYVEVNGKPIINYCLETFLSCKIIDIIIVGVTDEWHDYVKKSISKISANKPIYFTSPGETRQFSIYNALKTIQEIGGQSEDIVIIHDAARPLVSTQLINNCINACQESDGVLPVIPVKDTIYFSKDGNQIDNLLDRSSLWAGQAPEAFRFGKYFKAHEEMEHNELLKINGSTELAVKAGMQCKMIEGDPMNFKITTSEDLINFKNIIMK